MLVTTTHDIAGKRIVKTIGLVRGNTIRARHLGRDFMAGLKNMVGGEISDYTKMIAECREEALDRMIAQAAGQRRQRRGRGALRHQRDDGARGRTAGLRDGGGGRGYRETVRRRSAATKKGARMSALISNRPAGSTFHPRIGRPGRTYSSTMLMASSGQASTQASQSMHSSAFDPGLAVDHGDDFGGAGFDAFFTGVARSCRLMQALQSS